MSRNCMKLLEGRWSKGFFVCVGLDIDLKNEKFPRRLRSRIPNTRELIAAFGCDIVSATHQAVAAFKPNVAFFEAHGDKGWLALRDIVLHIHTVAPEVPVILDAKRADIGNTNMGYVEMMKWLDVDGITVNPYLGGEALEPFLKLEDKGIFVVVRTSNKGAKEFQDKQLDYHCCTFDSGHDEFEEKLSDYMPLYQYVAYRVATHWNKRGNCGVVVGATCPEELKAVREIVGDMPILIPGVGAQGGDLEAAVRNGLNSKGEGIIINSSRGIIYASSGDDFAEAARIEVDRLNSEIAKIIAAR